MMRLFIIGKNRNFSPDAVQRLGSVHGLSPGGALPWPRQLPCTVPHTSALRDLDRPGALGERLQSVPGPLPSYSATMAESASDRIGHLRSQSDRAGVFCQDRPRRTPLVTEGDLWELLVWVVVFLALVGFIGLTHR